MIQYSSKNLQGVHCSSFNSYHKGVGAVKRDREVKIDLDIVFVACFVQQPRVANGLGPWSTKTTCSLNTALVIKRHFQGKVSSTVYSQLKTLSTLRAGRSIDSCVRAGLSAGMAVWCGARVLPLQRRVYSITLVVRIITLFLLQDSGVDSDLGFDSRPFLECLCDVRGVCVKKQNYTLQCIFEGF